MSLLANYPALFLFCRAYGHNWDPRGGQMLTGGLQEDEFACACGCRKYEIWNIRTKHTWGKPKIEYPEGYRLGFPLTREDAKMEAREREAARRPRRKGD